MDKRPLAKNPNAGFTLIEITAAVAIWMVLMAIASQLLISSSRASADLTIRQDALERARVAVDTLVVNIQMADQITMRKRPDGMLRDLIPGPINASPNFQFTFTANQLRFGGHNELASDLREVWVTPCFDTDLMFIIVYVDLENDEYIRLTSTVDIRHKEVTLR